jgi:Flp pilus assembly protein TadD
MNRLLSSAALIAICVNLSGCQSFDLGLDLGLFDKTPDTNTAAKATTPESPQVSLDDELAKAHDMRVQGNYADAGRTLAQLVLFAPNDGRVVGEYGKLLTQQGNSKDAVEFLTQAIALKADDWTFYSALGVAYDQAGNRANAKLAYEKALSLKPDEPTVLNNLAVSRMLAKDYAGAQHYLDQAKAGDDANPKIAANLAMLTQLRGDKGVTAIARAPKHSTAPAKSQALASTAPKSLVPAPVQTKDLQQLSPAAENVASTQAQGSPSVTAQQIPQLRTATQPPANIVTAAAPKPQAKPAANTAALANTSQTTALMNHAPELRASTDDLRPATSEQ